MRLMKTWICIISMVVSLLFLISSEIVFSDTKQNGDNNYQTSLEIFERRIVPIMKSPNPSSCVECHLSGVDLKHYIKDSPQKTFVSLRDQGLIHLQEPSKSKILDLIRMSESDSPLMTQQTRQIELEAFTAWLEVSCQSEQLVNTPSLAKADLATPPVPTPVIRHARKDRVFDSFVTNIWSQIERCAGCHSVRNPDLKKLIDEHGEQVLWAFDTPEQTFQSIIKREYIDTQSPLESLLVMKPTMQVEHGGGKKMEIGDRGYKQFSRFIDDYVAVVNGIYEHPDQLPQASEFEYIGSEIWLKITPTPEKWGDKLLGVLIYPIDEKTGAFSDTPIAESDRRVWGKGELWQHNLILVAPRRSGLAQQLRETRRLPEGRYLVKLFCDTEGELEKDWQIEWADEKFFVGKHQLTSDWPVGYHKMTVIKPPES